MIKRSINIDNYWRVIVYYNVDYDSYRLVASDISNTTSPVEESMDALLKIITHKAKAFTINLETRVSIIVFAKHRTIEDYINSIVHEAEHVKQAMLEYYNINDSGEPPAYTIGYIASKLISIFRHNITRKFIIGY